MPGRQRKIYKTKKSFRSTASGGVGFSDVSVYDYAHVDKPIAGSARLKKGASKISLQQAKTLVMSEKTESDLNWFEKDLDDFAIKDSQVEDEDSAEAEEEQPSEEVTECTKRGRDRGRKKSENEDVDRGKSYPLDVWFLLSRYIRPEDIGTFASLSHSAHTVIQSAFFWRHLFFKYYKEGIQLPESLGVASVERSHGLRARVIRALYYIYPAFVASCKLSAVFHDEPHLLEGKRCVMCWYQRIADNIWRFNFKLKRERFTQKNSHSSTSKNGCVDLMNGYNDIFYNPEEGCCVLQVSCQSFIFNPMVMGLILTKVYLNVSHDMRHHKLRLIFDSQMKTTKKCSDIGTQIILDPVLNIRVFHWWDPQYMYQHVK